MWGLITLKLNRLFMALKLALSQSKSISKVNERYRRKKGRGRRLGRGGIYIFLFNRTCLNRFVPSRVFDQSVAGSYVEWQILSEVQKGGREIWAANSKWPWHGVNMIQPSNLDAWTLETSKSMNTQQIGHSDFFCLYMLRFYYGHSLPCIYCNGKACHRYSRCAVAGRIRKTLPVRGTVRLPANKIIPAETIPSV